MDGITGHKMRGRVGPGGRLETTKRVGKEFSLKLGVVLPLFHSMFFCWITFPQRFGKILRLTDLGVGALQLPPSKLSQPEIRAQKFGGHFRAPGRPVKIRRRIAAGCCVP